MTLKTVSTGAMALMLTLVGGWAATAQDAPPIPPSAETLQAERLIPAPDANAPVPPFDHTVQEMEGREIRGRWNARVGRVVRVLAADNGVPTAVAADVGGYAGTEAPVVLPLDQLLDQDGYLMVTLSEEQLDALPRWSP
ncbi:MAG TPA: PRC-barrel domain-containing protein [Methylomirabilota bacterium]|nr:PRC-barrel domain-containing protein [Methylomirabilota bacterium]